KSLVVAIVLAITAYMTLKGVFAVFRVAAIDPVAATLARPQDLPSLLAPALGVSRNALVAVLGAAVAAGLLAFIFKSRDFRTFDNILGGAVAGLVVVGCWALSGHVGHIAEDPATLEEKFLPTNSRPMQPFSFLPPYPSSLAPLL